MSLPKGIYLLGRGSERAVAYDPLRYSIDPLNDHQSVISSVRTRQTLGLLDAWVYPEPGRQGILCACGQHVITTAE